MESHELRPHVTPALAARERLIERSLAALASAPSGLAQATSVKTFFDAINRRDADAVVGMLSRAPHLARMRAGGWTALHGWAGHQKRRPRDELLKSEILILDALLAAGAEIDAQGAQGGYDDTPLYLAVHRGGVGHVRALLARGADPNVVFAASIPDCALGEAIYMCRDVVPDLIAAGADVNHRDRHGWRPLDQCCNYDEIIHLVPAGAMQGNVWKAGHDHAGAPDQRRCAPADLLSAIAAGDPAAVRACIQVDPDGLLVHDSRGETPLHHAFREYEPSVQDALRNPGATWAEILEAVISTGADVNQPDADGVPPLLWACRTKESGDRLPIRRSPFAALRLLNRVDCDVGCRDSEGLAPLHEAVSGHWPDCWTIPVLTRLLDRGADLHARDVVGRAAMHMVTDAEVAEFLLAAGAGVNAETLEGLTPLDSVVVRLQFAHEAVQGEGADDDYRHALEGLLDVLKAHGGVGGESQP